LSISLAAEDAIRASGVSCSKPEDVFGLNEAPTPDINKQYYTQVMEQAVSLKC
jgi:hypothetical protein